MVINSAYSLGPVHSLPREVRTELGVVSHADSTSAAIPEGKKKTPWPESASEVYRPSDGRLSTKLVPTFADRGCHVVSVMDPYSSILGFLDRSHYFFFQVAPQLYSRGSVNFVPDPLLLRISGSAGSRTLTIRPQRQYPSPWRGV
jgi:hypothetical protein